MGMGIKTINKGHTPEIRYRGWYKSWHMSHGEHTQCPDLVTAHSGSPGDSTWPGHASCYTFVVSNNIELHQLLFRVYSIGRSQLYYTPLKPGTVLGNDFVLVCIYTVCVLYCNKQLIKWHCGHVLFIVLLFYIYNFLFILIKYYIN